VLAQMSRGPLSLCCTHVCAFYISNPSNRTQDEATALFKVNELLPDLV